MNQSALMFLCRGTEFYLDKLYMFQSFTKRVRLKYTVDVSSLHWCYSYFFKEREKPQISKEQGMLNVVMLRTLSSFEKYKSNIDDVGGKMRYSRNIQKKRAIQWFKTGTRKVLKNWIHRNSVSDASIELSILVDDQIDNQILVKIQNQFLLQSVV